MEINDKKFSVSKGDTVLIKDGDFHRVHAGNEGCYFVYVFDSKKRSHRKFLIWPLYFLLAGRFVCMYT